MFELFVNSGEPDQTLRSAIRILSGRKRPDIDLSRMLSGWDFLCSGFRSLWEPILCSITVFEITVDSRFLEIQGTL